MSILNKFKMFLRPALKLFGVALITGIIIFTAVVWLERLAEYENRQNQPPQPLPPILVTATQLDCGSVTDWVVGEGRAEAVRKQFLQFEETGRVTFLAKENDGQPIREGSRIDIPAEKTVHGQLLASLDSRDKQSTVKEIKAVLSEAQNTVKIEESALKQVKNELIERESDYKRQKILFKKNALSRRNFEQASTQYRNALAELNAAQARLDVAVSKVEGIQAQLDKAERSLEKSAIFAPFSGIIARINIREGDYFDPENVNHTDDSLKLETAPITIIDPSEMEITLDLPEFEGKKLQVEQRVMIVPGATDWFKKDTVKNFPILKGTVYAISPLINVTRRAIRVKVRMKQFEQYPIKDGMYVSCWIASNVRQKILRVPLTCLLFQSDVPYVYVCEKNTAKKRILKLGVIDNQYAEVLSGLTIKDKVISKGRKQLSDSYPVKIVNKGCNNETGNQ